MKSIARVAALAAASITTAAHAGDISGPRAELLVGYDHVSMGFDEDSANANGVAFGGGIGYDVALASRVSVGVDGEITGSSSKYTETNPLYSLGIKYGRDLYAGGRVTFQASKNVNLYAKVGYTNTRVKFNGEDAFDRFERSENYNGVRAGVGAQVRVSGPLYGALEYRYSNYEANLSRHQVLAGIGYRF